MPSRWWVPIPGLRLRFIQPEHVHAATSRWLDWTQADHAANHKPYSIGRLTTHPKSHSTGVEVATLTDDASERLLQSASDGTPVRLGNQERRTGQPVTLQHEPWAELAHDDGSNRWQLTFLTPTTFRSGNRSSPLPKVTTILDGLAQAWDTWSGQPHPTPRPSQGSVSVTALELRSETVTRTIPSSTVPRPLRFTGVRGTLDLRCDDAEQARYLGSLLRLAPYAGVGSMTCEGLGMTRVQPRPPASPPPRHGPGR